MSIIKHVTLQKIVAHDFRYVPRSKLHQFCVTQQIYLQLSCSFTCKDCGISCSDDAVSFMSHIVMWFFRGITGSQFTLLT